MIKECKQCQKNFKSDRHDRKFCSQSCSASFNNKNVRIYVKRIKPARYCLNCPEQLGPDNYKYCSNKCQRTLNSSRIIKEWLDGKRPGHTSHLGVCKYIRKWMLERAGWKCEKCQWAETNPITGTIPLHVDHIDGDSTNTIPCNLRVLCPNCHSLTNTFGSLNMGKGRTVLKRSSHSLVTKHGFLKPKTRV